MEKPIAVDVLQEAKDFIKKLPVPVQKKLILAFDKVEQGYKGDWFVKMPDTDDLYEFRVDGPNHTYRVFAFWDPRGETETLVVCTHGLDKKTQKTPASDIKKAQRIRQMYFQGGS